MVEILLISKILVFLIDIIGIWLAFWVYFFNPKSKTNQLFALTTFFMLLWVTFGYLSNLPGQIHYALLWKRLIFGAVSLFFVSAYFFSIYFPKKGKKNPIFDKTVLGLGIISFFISIFTNLIIKDIEIKEWGADVVLGKWVNIFYVTIILLTFFILFSLFKKYFILSIQEKLKIQYFLVGVFVFAFLNLVFNIISPSFLDSFRYNQFGNYSAIFLLVFTAYAIVKRELFGIKLVLTALLVGLIAILLLVDIFILTEGLFTQLFKGLFLLIFLYFGYLLIRSVLKEIALRVELEKAYKELKKLDVAKSEFISIASHQLRTPLTAIKGYISLINEKIYGRPPKKMKRPLENIYTSTERLIKLVSDLLNISRIEAGKIKLEIEKFPLEDIIDSVVVELKNLAKKKKLYLKWERPKRPLPKVLVDKDRIRQVILNVVDNGIRYTERGGVTIRYRKGNKMCKLIVSDTGEGMIKKEISNLFKSFTRGALGQRTWTEGTGLGLYIAKKFVDIHNGRIWAKSPGKGKGSTFYIELPTA